MGHKDLVGRDNSKGISRPFQRLVDCPEVVRAHRSIWFPVNRRKSMNRTWSRWRLFILAALLGLFPYLGRNTSRKGNVPSSGHGRAELGACRPLPAELEHSSRLHVTVFMGFQLFGANKHLSVT
jgi:hypothetical protein